MVHVAHRRQLQTGLLRALGDTAVVCLAGASRTGKRSLVQALLPELPGAAWRTFADLDTRTEATRDPGGFLGGLPALAVLEDVDRVPALLPWLQLAVAGGRRFLLTRSGTLPGLAESLSGRASPSMREPGSGPPAPASGRSPSRPSGPRGFSPTGVLGGTATASWRGREE